MKQAIVVSCAILLSLGCHKESRAGRGSRFALTLSEPVTIDPTFVSDEAGAVVCQNIFEGLLNNPPDNGPMRPGVAARYTVTRDGLRYTFFLRHDAKWSDGSRVTSADFIFAYKRLLSPRSGAPQTEMFYIIKGAHDYNTGKTKIFDKVGIRADGPYKLIFDLRAPAPYFPRMLGYAAFAPLPRKIVSKWGRQWTRPVHIVTNGPYMLKTYRPQDRIMLQKSPWYWNKDKVHMDRVVFYFINDPQLAYQWFRSGRIQWMKGSLSASMIHKLRRDKDPQLHIDPYLCTYYLAPNLTKGPLQDAGLRRAISMAIDRSGFATIFGGSQEGARHFVPTAIRMVSGYTPPSDLMRFDPVAARRLYDNYLKRKGKQPQITLLFNTGGPNAMAAQYVAQQIKRHLNLKIKLEVTDWKTLISRVRHRDFILARASWCADYPDPQNFLAILESDSPNNYPAYKNPAYDQLVQKAILTADAGQRNRLFQQAEAIMLKDTAVIPLFFYNRIYMLSRKVHGFMPNIMDRHPIMYLYY